MRVSLVGGCRLDWDEVLYEVPVVGRDFEVLLLGGDFDLLRGPMGSFERVGDDLRVRPELLVRRRPGKPAQFVTILTGSDALRVSLTANRAVRLPDASIVIVDLSSAPAYRLCAPGDRVLASPAYGLVVSE